MFKTPVVPLKDVHTRPAETSERRAIWSREEDELILLIKVTSLYFFPNEKRITFKLISDIMNQIVPDKCHDKKISSFGRRIKALLKSNLNLLFVSNKLELCKQDKEIEKKYAKALSKLKRSLVDHEQVDTYKNFVIDLRDKFLKRSYSNEAPNESGQAGDAGTVDNEVEFELPKTMEEFNRKYTVKNSLSGLFGNQKNDYQQPKSDYEISFNTLHSAIHVSLTNRVLVSPTDHHLPWILYGIELHSDQRQDAAAERIP